MTTRPEPSDVLAEPCPWCGEEGYDSVYLDEQGVPRHTVCRNDVRTSTIERVLAARRDAAPDSSWQTDAEGYVIEPLVNGGTLRG